jgi:hypothetical protein
MLTGSFTGIVEPGDIIELGDLSSFSAQLAGLGVNEVEPLLDLTLFSYLTMPASTPEPASMFLTGPALLGLGIFLRRRAIS